VEHSSRIHAWPGDPVIGLDGSDCLLAGNEVVTVNGTLYSLGGLDPQVKSVVTRIYPQFSDLEPLRRGTEYPMLLAERLVYGAAASKVAQLGQLLREVEGEVRSLCGPVLDDQVAGQFGAAREALGALGVICPP
jgi:hypothetical protein